MALDYNFTYVRDGKALKPFDHQVKTVEFLTSQPGGAYVLSDAGTGKTLSVLWAWHCLHLKGAAGRLAVFAPLQTLQNAWASEIVRAMPQVKFALVRGTAKKRDEIVADTSNKVLIFNHHGVTSTIDALLADTSITHVCIDEMTAFSNPSSGLFKNMARFTKERVVWAMTATPVAQGPEKAWGPSRIVNPMRQNMTYRRWFEHVLYNSTPNKPFPTYLPRPEAKQRVFDMLQPAIRFDKSECHDLPGVTFSDLDCQLSDEQRKFLTALRRDWMLETDDPSPTKTASSRAIKVLQVLAGDVIVEDEDPVRLDNNGKLSVLLDVIAEAPTNVILFSWFTLSVNRVAAQLREALGPDKVVMMNGQTAPQDRQVALDLFDRKVAKVLVCNPKTTAHGLNLTAASTIVWWTPASSELYAQGNERTNRPGQLNPTTVYNLISHPVEARLYEALRTKSRFEASLLTSFKEFIR